MTSRRSFLCFYINERDWPARDHLRPDDTHADGDLGRGEPRQHHGGGPRLDRDVRHRPHLRRHRVRGRDRHHGLRQEAYTGEITQERRSFKATFEAVTSPRRK